MRLLISILVLVTALVAVALALPVLVSSDRGPGFLPRADPRADGMVFVPAGFFTMGSTEAHIEALHRSYRGSRALYESEFPRRRIYVDAFYIDRTEVTQAQYKEFVDATGHSAPLVDREWAVLYNWKGDTFPDGLAGHPVVLVSYHDAAGYCRWAGKALPTEAEWEKAARGVGGRIYPWGDRWDSTRLNSPSTWSDHELPTIEIWTTWWKETYHGRLRGKVVTTVPVGGYPSGASTYGALDMAGNVFEWTADWFEAYPSSPYQNPDFGMTYRAIRGGDWYLDRIYTRAAARLRSPPEHQVPTIGFRCVCREGDRTRQPGVVAVR